MSGNNLIPQTQPSFLDSARLTPSPEVSPAGNPGAQANVPSNLGFAQILLQSFESAVAQEMALLSSNIQNPSAGGNAIDPSVPFNTFSSTQQWLLSNLTDLSASPVGFAGPTFSMNNSVNMGMTGIPQQGMSLQTPGSLQAIVANASAQYQVPEKLIQSVIQQESGFNPGAVSPAGAVGLMQLMPATWQQYQVTNPYDAQQNVDAGTRYLKDLLTRYHGNVTLAVAAYNAGPGAVDRYGGVPPYPETQQYVKNVVGQMTPGNPYSPYSNA